MSASDSALEALERENARLQAELAELRMQRAREQLGKQTLEEVNRVLSNELFHARIVQEASKVADAGEDLAACAVAVFDVIARVIGFRWIGLQLSRDGHASVYTRPPSPRPAARAPERWFEYPFRRNGTSFGTLQLDASTPLSDDDRQILETICRHVSPILEHNLLIRLLKELLSFREEFVHMLGHDLRNPLTGIISALDTALMPGLPLPEREREELFRTALASARMVNELLGDLLDVAKLDAGQLTVTLEPTDLGAIAEQSLQAFRGFAAAKRLALALEVPEGLPLVSTDERAVRRVFANLIVNALKFTQHGGVLVRLRRLEAAVEVTIADTGFGVPKEAQSRLFEKFYQVPGADAKSGTGLGLAFCRQMLTALGGTIGIQSPSDLAHETFAPPEPRDPGAAFRFTLPIAT